MNPTHYLYHEHLHRGAEIMNLIAGLRITLCGAGALGANLAESLGRMGFRQLRVIDRDRIEERNLSTQPWQRGDIGGFKATMLANALYRSVGVEAKGIAKELTDENVNRLLEGSDIVLDLFDNSVGRAVLKKWSEAYQVPCLHAGLTSDYAEVIWNDEYRVPSPANDDICDYPLTRNLVTIAVGVVGETLLRFVESGVKENRTITLKDFAIERME